MLQSSKWLESQRCDYKSISSSSGIPSKNRKSRPKILLKVEPGIVSLYTQSTVLGSVSRTSLFCLTILKKASMIEFLSRGEYSNFCPKGRKVVQNYENKIANPPASADITPTVEMPRNRNPQWRRRLATKAVKRSKLKILWLEQYKP